MKGYDLLMKRGWFRKNVNEGGVVKDHKFSINVAYGLRIDPAIIGHPANCAFLTQIENCAKGDACSEDLKTEIMLFNLNID